MKVKILCGIVAVILVTTGAFLLFGCGKSNTPPSTPPADGSQSTLLAKPDNATPADLSARESLYVAAGELSRAGGFRSSTEGSAISLGITQSVSALRTVSKGNVFKQSTSHSALVKFGEQLFVWGENYLSRSAQKVTSTSEVTWQNTAVKHSAQAWAEKIGYRNDGLSGYVLNDQTITEAELVSQQGEYYTFRYVLDCQTATCNVLYEMRNNSGMDGFATFLKAELTVVMDKNFIVQTLSTDCEYKVPMLGGINCKENLTETFFDIGYDGELPEQQFFMQFMQAEETEQDRQPTATEVLMQSFGKYAQSMLYADVTATIDGKSVSAQAAIKMDVANMTAEAHVKAGDALLSYVDGGVSVAYRQFKASLGSIAADLLGALDGKEIDLQAHFDGDTCTVAIPISTPELNAEITITCIKKQTYEFCGGEITAENFRLTITPSQPWQVPETENYPEIDGIDVVDGKIYAKLQALGMTADVAADLKAQSAVMQTEDMLAVLKEGTIYLNLPQSNLKIDTQDLPDMVSEALQLLGKSISFEFDVESLLLLLQSNVSTTPNSLTVTLPQGEISLVLTERDGKYIPSIRALLGGEQITLTPSEQFAARQLAEGEYADVAALTKKLLPKLAQLAQGAVNAQFDLTYGVYRAFGNAVFAPNAPLFADARIGIGQTTAPASLWLENNRLYAEISGMPLAVDLSQTGLNLPDLSSLLSETLAQADLSPQRIAEILMSARITEDSITIPSGVLPFEVTLGADATVLCRNEDFSLQAKLTETSAPMLPQRQWNTQLEILIDQNNTLYADVDMLNDKYLFRLGQLNACYTDSTLYVKKGDDIAVSADVAAIKQLVEKIDEIVKEFAGVTAKALTAQTSPIDFSLSEQNGALKISAAVKEAQIEVLLGEEVSITVCFAEMRFTARPCRNVTFDSFDGDYVAIDQVIADFLQPIDALIHTNSWTFDIGESFVDVTPTDGTGTVTYAILQGSCVKFYYNAANKQDFALHAQLALRKIKDGVTLQETSLEAVFADGRVYVTYNNALRATVLWQSVVNCARQTDRLLQIIPQIGQLLSAITSAGDISPDYSTVLQRVSYADGKFSLTINGGVLLSQLGDIRLTASGTDKTLILNCLEASYGENNPHTATINVRLNDVTVRAEQAQEGEYPVFENIQAYFDKNGEADAHINFDSAEQLLKTVADTAQQDVFAIDGSVQADLSLIGIIKEKVNMTLSARVDILRRQGQEDVTTFTVKLSRPKQSLLSLVNVAFNDYGGDSYLFFNGQTQEITIVRNSYVKKGLFGIEMKQKDYYEKVTAQQFAQQPEQYVLQMVNFSGWINDLITKEGESSSAAIEEVLKDYRYQEGKFMLELNLAPIDANLGMLNATVSHSQQQDKYLITSLEGDVKLLSDMMTATVNLQLAQDALYGEATQMVANETFW